MTWMLACDAEMGLAMTEPEDNILSTPAAAQWQAVGIANHHGFDIPLFSLHSKTSSGIGEFPDLLPLIPWVKELGMDVIQLLPINDSGPENSPYLTLSAYALNPMYLGLALTLLGWGVFLSNALAFVFIPAFIVYMNRFQIGPEERALEFLFAQDFLAYKAKVRRWL